MHNTYTCEHSSRASTSLYKKKKIVIINSIYYRHTRYTYYNIQYMYNIVTVLCL